MNQGLRREVTARDRNLGFRPGAVSHTCNLSTLGDQAGWIKRSRDRDHSGQHGETPSLQKYKYQPGVVVVHAFSPSY